MKKTYKELAEIDQLIGGLYAKDPNLKDTKFGYAYKRFSDINFVPTINKFRERLEIIRTNNALEDSATKAVIMDQTNPRGFKYSREGLIKCIEEEAKLNIEFDAEEIEIKPYISAYVPELLDEQKELLTGLII